MRIFPRPIVVVSKCIEFEPVGWDGRIISNDLVKQLKNHVDFLPVCPEVGIGLGVPRDPLRLVLRAGKPHLIQPSTGLDFTTQLETFAEKFLNNLGEVDGFILRSKSPSSALKDARIYPAEQKVAAIGRGPGIFGKAVLEKFGAKAVEDDKRLLNSRIRQHFLTKLYTLANFRAVRKAGSEKALVDFQAKNKLLLTAYSQVQLHIMGRIVAERKNRNLPEVLNDYETHLIETLKVPPKAGSNYNVLTKAAGYFTTKLSHEEKAFFLEKAQRYKTGLEPLSTPLNVLKFLIIRYNESYLEQQTFFEPYPETLQTPLDEAEKSEKDYWK